MLDEHANSSIPSSLSKQLEPDFRAIATSCQHHRHIHKHVTRYAPGYKTCANKHERQFCLSTRLVSNKPLTCLPIWRILSLTNMHSTAGRDVESIRREHMVHLISLSMQSSHHHVEPTNCFRPPNPRTHAISRRLRLCQPCPRTRHGRRPSFEISFELRTLYPTLV
ncbi:hypothetical protein BU23DRAFT_85743 [Bimuria novae-zelandiae CBS 107.79]|uniref:Uncharacterized protein n=1 Tax=Bimuria novae-zelandiae CBS 107.79 TaxID=1447943 RepID=A0A6A5VE71_9PLEO|nr:hypothetical protein BU23DRAFT_85743 [Bimuria novae-zelandiae CBS 107.79]